MIERYECTTSKAQDNDRILSWLAKRTFSEFDSVNRGAAAIIISGDGDMLHAILPFIECGCIRRLWCIVPKLGHSALSRLVYAIQRDVICNQNDYGICASDIADLTWNKDAWNSTNEHAPGFALFYNPCTEPDDNPMIEWQWVGHIEHLRVSEKFIKDEIPIIIHDCLASLHLEGVSQIICDYLCFFNEWRPSTNISTIFPASRLKKSSVVQELTMQPINADLLESIGMRAIRKKYWIGRKGLSSNVYHRLVIDNGIEWLREMIAEPMFSSGSND